MADFDPEALVLEYRRAQSGEPRMRAIRTAISAAELAGDSEALIRFHHDLIKDSVFSGDRYQALIDFPQYLAAVNRDEATAAAHLWDTLWMYKWILEAATEFWQIEKKQINKWFSQYRSEMIRAGYSLRPFYQKRAIFNSYCDRAKLRLDYADFLAAPHDRMCDSEADEYDTIVRWELVIGDRDKALKAAEHIFSKGWRSDEIPAYTYGSLLADALRRGDHPNAHEYARLLRPFCDGERFRLEQTGLLLCYDALADPARGMAFYRKNASLREGSRNPFLCFWFDRGAARLLRAAGQQGKRRGNMRRGHW